MVQLLVTKRDDGSYGLSDRGLRQAYFKTMHKLLVHYAQSGLKKTPEEVNLILRKYQQFASQELANPDDYLDKLPQLAQLIGESNAARFGAFIGQHFLTHLEKTQQVIVEAELPKAKDIYENPYRAPSNDLLLQFADIFRNAQPLVWPPAAQPTETDNGEAAPAQGTPGIPVAAQGPAPLPGLRLLQQIQLEFENAKPLQWTPDGASNQEQGDGDNTSTAATIENKLPVQITLREYTQLSSMVARFTKAKDNKGYQEWYSTLNARAKLILHLNTLITKSEKGAEVYWQSEYAGIGQRTGQTPEIIRKMKEEIAAYRLVVGDVQKALHQSIQAGLPGQQAQQIYPQVLSLVENKDTLAAKRTAMKMTLLAVMVPTAKVDLEKSLGELINRLGELYLLPEA